MPLRGRLIALFASLALVTLTACSGSSADRLPPDGTSTGGRDSDSDPAAVLDAAISASPDTYRQLRSVPVVVDGKVVVQRYYGGGTATAGHDVESVGKTIVGTLIGVAIEEKKIAGLDATLDSLLPEYRSSMSPAQARITLRQLLTMTAGIGDDTAVTWTVGAKTDWVRAALEFTPAGPPGSRFMYSSAGSHMLSAILERATGRSTLEYAQEKLFAPMGIGAGTWATPGWFDPDAKQVYRQARYAWPTDPQGRSVGGGCPKLTASDLAALGQLWLDKGRWEGRQLVPAAYLSQAQRRQADTGDGESEGYGFQQWIIPIEDDPAFWALGRGGQVVGVVPSRRTVVVVQSEIQPWEPEVPGAAGNTNYVSLISQVILPSLD